MTACNKEMRSLAFSGSFSLTISPQSWRTRSALYTNAPPPKGTFSYRAEDDELNTGNYVSQNAKPGPCLRVPDPEGGNEKSKRAADLHPLPSGLAPSRVRCQFRPG